MTPNKISENQSCTLLIRNNLLVDVIFPRWLFIEIKKQIKEITFTSISLYQLVLLDALQLATGATGLFSQGVTAVVHGCSVCALGHNLGEETGFITATLQEGSESARNHTRHHS